MAGLHIFEFIAILRLDALQKQFGSMKKLAVTALQRQKLTVFFQIKYRLTLQNQLA